MFYRILVPTDGSNQSEKALLVALNLALQNKSYLEILHISQVSTERMNETFEQEGVDPFSSSSIRYKVINDYYHYLRKQNMDMLQKQLDKALKIAPTLEITTNLLEGNPGEEIVKRSRDGKFDLIVMGSFGLGLRRYLLGSTSARVVSEAKIPILIIK